jgi:hypothetical protein
VTTGAVIQDYRCEYCRDNSFDLSDSAIDKLNGNLSKLWQEAFCNWLRPFRDAMLAKRDKIEEDDWTGHDQGTLDTYHFILRQMGDTSD